MISFSVSDDLTARLQALAAIMPNESRRAAGLAGLAMIEDALTKAPTPPVLTGNLRGSWFVYAGNELISEGPDSGAPRSIDAPPISTSVGFNTRYAMKMHENLEPAGPYKKGPYSEQAGDVGGKFLESKMIAYRSRYAKIIADALKKFIDSPQKRGWVTRRANMGSK